MVINFKGIWFFGLAGSGKTFASAVVEKIIKHSFLIDGDKVRQYVSFDLGYTLADRAVQLDRLIGLSKIVLNNNFFPVCTSVFMTQKIFNECKKEKIEVVKIERSYDEIKKLRKIYETGINVVGKDLHQENFNTPILFNDGTKNFENLVEKHVFKNNS
jgi:hypothetical protein